MEAKTMDILTIFLESELNMTNSSATILNNLSWRLNRAREKKGRDPKTIERGTQH